MGAATVPAIANSAETRTRLAHAEENAVNPKEDPYNRVYLDQTYVCAACQSVNATDLAENQSLLPSVTEVVGCGAYQQPATPASLQ